MWLEKAILGVFLSGVLAVLYVAWVSEPVGPDHRLRGPVRFSVCGFKLRYGRPCPTCYMTRSFVLMAEGRVATAVKLQPMGAFLFALLVALVPTLVYAIFFRRTIWTWIERIPWRAVFLILFLLTAAAWGYTLSRN